MLKDPFFKIAVLNRLVAHEGFDRDGYNRFAFTVLGLSYRAEEYSELWLPPELFGEILKNLSWKDMQVSANEEPKPLLPGPSPEQEQDSVRESGYCDQYFLSYLLGALPGGHL